MRHDTPGDQSPSGSKAQPNEVKAQPTGQLHVFPTAATRPTDERAGRAIRAHKASCPFCGAEGTVKITIQLCHQCGEWFEAIPDASQKKGNGGDGE